MKITAIKQQIKRQDRYSIYVDDKYLFSFSENELIGSGLKVNQELSERELLALKDQAVLGKAYDRALNLISHRPRSEWELRDYLKRKDYDEDVITSTIERLHDRGYVNDLDFARRWVQSRRLLKSTSKRRLSQELRQKRIADDVISQVLEADETDERQVLRELIERKRKQTKYQDNLKLMQYLSRQGFNYDDIKIALAKE
ncbi:MAG TPA: RecX family transcriptional regulator [Candidatus Limnocylindria bacterium]|nr:RecX family transcriptional regulator [Candidatus Limnocylindria bacterium]